MAVFRELPYGNARFRVELDGIDPAGFLIVQLPELIIEYAEYREGSDPLPQSTPVAKRPRFGTLVLKRGFHGKLDLYQWWQQAATGEAGARRNGVIKLETEDRSAVAAAWRVSGMLPVRYAFAPLDAQDGATLVEMIEIACQNVQLE